MVITVHAEIAEHLEMTDNARILAEFMEAVWNQGERSRFKE
jgi:hypothetical protein